MAWAPDHPNRQKSGYVLQHIQVMSDHLGRALLQTEEVHHRNGVRNDNRLSNLELWTRSQPRGQRVVDKLAWAREILALYEGTEPLLGLEEPGGRVPLGHVEPA
jgi:hypothetical protein